MARYAHQRTSDIRYKSRPPANRRAARWAWDHFTKGGPVQTLWLGQGHWMVMRPEGFTGETKDEIDATIVRWESIGAEIKTRMGKP